MRWERILPGGRIGILGGGQLGRMTAFAAKRMGYWVATLDPSPHAPCGQVVDHQMTAPYSDLEAVKRLGQLCDVITYEFENVSAESVEALEAQGKTVHPHSRVLKVKQSRLMEKESLRKAGVDVASFQAVRSPEELKAASKRIGFPAVLKTLSWGYDGRGQAWVDSEEQALQVFEALGREPVLWEQRVPFVKELGVVGVRGVDGSIVTYPVTENVHVDGILHTTMAPARVSQHVEHNAREIARTVAVAFDLVGAFCVEMFLLEEGRILVNEIAPRPHNSGHYSIEACITSQFEQHVRAICGLPLGSAELRSAAVMVNLLGSGKGNTLIGVEQLLKEPAVYLHLYGKREARPRRKMGHFTVLASSPEEALKTAERLRGKLAWAPSAHDSQREGAAD